MLEATQMAAPAAQSWNIAFETVECERCQWRYVLPAGPSARACPNCCHNPLVVLAEGSSDLTHPYTPELVLPFEVPKNNLQQVLEDFCAGIPFAPKDLNPAHLRANLRAVYLPMWLVDADVAAQWQAEAGFDYKVVSHQEHYHQTQSSWKSHKIREKRIRWEDRAGRIHRDYHNVAIPALEDADHLEKRLGAFDQKRAQPYEPEHLHNALVRLPDFPPNEAWSEVVPALQRTSTQDCQQACGANHMRQFRWKARFSNFNWTLMLMPVYATFYLDDSRRPQPVLIHGQTGKISGKRQASIQRAKSVSLIILAVSIFIVLTGLINLLKFRYDIPRSYFDIQLSYVIVQLAIPVLLSAAIPYLIAVGFNYQQQQKR